MTKDMNVLCLKTTPRDAHPTGCPPSDLGDWAFFAPQEVVSVADGTASSDLVVKRQVADVEVSVYDFSVFDTCRNSTGAVTNACNYCTVKRSHNSVRKSCTVDAQYLGATVRQLGADAPDARRRARNVLRAFGPAAYDVMRQYRKDANPEIRMTIQELLNEHLSRESGKGEAVDRD